MIQDSITPQPTGEAGNPFDRLLSDYFKAQLPTVWPALPELPRAEPLKLAASHSAERIHSSVRASDLRSRLTLAASIALLLGVCWLLSNGYQPSPRSEPTASPDGLLRGAAASNPASGVELRKDNAIKVGPRTPLRSIKLP